MIFKLVSPMFEVPTELDFLTYPPVPYLGPPAGETLPLISVATFDNAGAWEQFPFPPGGVIVLTLLGTGGAPTSAVLGGTTQKPINGAGQADFDDLTIDTPGTYILRLSSLDPLIAPWDSDPFTISPPLGVLHLVWTIQPPSIIGVPLGEGNVQDAPLGEVEIRAYNGASFDSTANGIVYLTCMYQDPFGQGLIDGITTDSEVPLTMVDGVVNTNGLYIRLSASMQDNFVRGSVLTATMDGYGSANSTPFDSMDPTLDPTLPRVFGWSTGAVWAGSTVEVFGENLDSFDLTAWPLGTSKTFGVFPTVEVTIDQVTPSALTFSFQPSNTYDGYLFYFTIPFTHPMQPTYDLGLTVVNPATPFGNVAVAFPGMPTWSTETRTGRTLTITSGLNNLDQVTGVFLRNDGVQKRYPLQILSQAPGQIDVLVSDSPVGTGWREDGYAYLEFDWSGGINVQQGTTITHYADSSDPQLLIGPILWYATGANSDLPATPQATQLSGGFPLIQIFGDGLRFSSLFTPIDVEVKFLDGVSQYVAAGVYGHDQCIMVIPPDLIPPGDYEVQVRTYRGWGTGATIGTAILSTNIVLT